MGCVGREAKKSKRQLLRGQRAKYSYQQYHGEGEVEAATQNLPKRGLAQYNRLSIEISERPH